ncbi:hypothetical protein CDB3_02530 [Bacillus sp. CDB3]|nr:hypothetical protein CDB3_02530 [Bacillus sp. CDB3]
MCANNQWVWTKPPLIKLSSYAYARLVRRKTSPIKASISTSYLMLKVKSVVSTFRKVVKVVDEK